VFWVEAGQKETIERDYFQIYRLLFPEVAVTGGGSSTTVKDASLIGDYLIGASLRGVLLTEAIS
jgi:hypothetical protein